MHVTVSASAIAIALAASLGTVTASGQSASNQRVEPAQAAPVASRASAPETRPFAALSGVKALPMSSAELSAVKGQDAHFATPSKNELLGITGLHVVVRNNRDHWLDLGNGILVAPGYRGLCGAALNSPKMFIPGQNEATGIGGGC
jgi:hypothetical protein